MGELVFVCFIFTVSSCPVFISLIYLPSFVLIASFFRFCHTCCCIVHSPYIWNVLVLPTHTHTHTHTLTSCPSLYHFSFFMCLYLLLQILLLFPHLLTLLSVPTRQSALPHCSSFVHLSPTFKSLHLPLLSLRPIFDSACWFGFFVARFSPSSTPSLHYWPADKNWFMAGDVAREAGREGEGKEGGIAWRSGGKVLKPPEGVGF